MDSPQLLPDLSLIFGSLVLGFIFASILYGVLCVQVLLYYTNFPKDRIYTKIYVATLFTLETLFMVFSTIEAWTVLGSGWGNHKWLTDLHWSAGPFPIICGLVTSMVHAFYCWRIGMLVGRWWVPGLIGVVSLTQLAMTVVLTVEFGVHGISIDTLRAATDIAATWLLTAAACDIVIAVAMVTILLRARHKTGVSHTSTVIQRLIHMVVETGVITSLGAILDAGLFLGFKDNNLHFIVFYSLAKLYSNTMLATLNARASIKRPADSNPVTDDEDGGGPGGGGAEETFWSDQGPRGDPEKPVRFEIERSDGDSDFGHTGTAAASGGPQDNGFRSRSRLGGALSPISVHGRRPSITINREVLVSRDSEEDDDEEGYPAKRLDGKNQKGVRFATQSDFYEDENNTNRAQSPRPASALSMTRPGTVLWMSRPGSALSFSGGRPTSALSLNQDQPQTRPGTGFGSITSAGKRGPSGDSDLGDISASRESSFGDNVTLASVLSAQAPSVLSPTRAAPGLDLPKVEPLDWEKKKKQSQRASQLIPRSGVVVGGEEPGLEEVVAHEKIEQERAKESSERVKESLRSSVPPPIMVEPALVVGNKTEKRASQLIPRSGVLVGGEEAHLEPEPDLDSQRTSASIYSEQSTSKRASSQTIPVQARSGTPVGGESTGDTSSEAQFAAERQLSPTTPTYPSPTESTHTNTSMHELAGLIDWSRFGHDTDDGDGNVYVHGVAARSAVSFLPIIQEAGEEDEEGEREDDLTSASDYSKETVRANAGSGDSDSEGSFGGGNEVVLKERGSEDGGPGVGLAV